MRFRLISAAANAALMLAAPGAASTGPNVAEQNKQRFRKLLEDYDARDADGFAIVIVQAIAALTLEALSRILGVPPVTVERWSTRASTPPYLTRAAAVHIVADAIDRGPSKTDDEKKALVRRVQTQVAADLDHIASTPNFISMTPKLAVNNEFADAR